MPAAAPNTIAQELLDKLNELRVAVGTPDEFTSRKLRAEAEKLKKSDVAFGFAILGMIDTLCWKADDAQTHWKRAIEQDSSRADLADNHARSLMDLGFPNKAADLAMQNVKRFPDDPTILDHTLNLLASALRFADGKLVLDRMAKLNIKSSDSLAPEIFMAGAEMFGPAAIRERVASMMDFVGAFSRSKRIRITGSQLGIGEHDVEELPIVYGARMPVTADLAATLSFEFAEELVKRRPDHLDDDILLIRFIPHGEGYECQSELVTS